MKKINYNGFVVTITVFAVVKILIHLLNPEYGYHRDELYYLAICKNLSLLNLDMPPLTPAYLKFITAIFGYSLKAVHFASALCGATSLVFSCMITRELKGGTFAVFLTGLFILFSGFLIFGGLFSYDSLDFLLIIIALYIILKIINSGNQKLWLLFGVVMGLGLINKLTILFFGLSVFISMWFVPQRKYFREKWIWLAGIIALFFLVPFLLWQSKNGWYFLDFAKNYAGGNSYITSLPEFIWNQVIGNNALNFPVWGLGLYLLLFSKSWSAYRIFGIIYLVLFLVFFLAGAKFYFLLPAYSVLLSAASIRLENILQEFNSSPVKYALLKYCMPVAYIILSLPTAVLCMPLVSVGSFSKIAKYIGVDAGVKHSYEKTNQLPQHFADRFGWEEMTAEVSKIYESIPIDKKDSVGILADNWGEASAIDLFGQKYLLPEVICPDGWFYFEELRKKNFKGIYISFGIAEPDLSEIFQSVERKAVFKNDYCMPHENNKVICLCRFPKYDLDKLWYILYHVDDKFLSLIRTGNIDSAISSYRYNKNLDPKLLWFTREQISAVGYNLMQKGKTDDALKIFLFNVEVYPNSSYAYYGLGEAYRLKGNRDLAISNFRKAVELYPENSRARSRLEEIINQ